jgi:hypothetical protein
MKRLGSGYFVARLQVSEDVARFAAQAAQRGGYFGAQDYLNAVLNTAMLEVMDRDDPTYDTGFTAEGTRACSVCERRAKGRET